MSYTWTENHTSTGRRCYHTFPTLSKAEAWMIKGVRDGYLVKSDWTLTREPKEGRHDTK